MTKIRCVTFQGSDCRTYTTPKGNSYEFYQGRFTEVKDHEDALHFLNAGNAFETEDVKEKVIKALEGLIKKIVKEKEVDEEHPPEETGALEPTADELKDDDGTAPIDGEPEAKEEPKAEEPKEEAPKDEALKEEEKPVNEDGTEGKNILTKVGIKKLVKDQQVFLIKQIQGETAEIPGKEAGRVDLLFKLQEEGADLQTLLKKFE